MKIPDKYITYLFSIEKYILFLLITFSFIFLVVIYFVFFPKTYSFSCIGETTKRVLTIPDNQVISKSKFTDENSLNVNKYFFGYFYSINNSPILNCSLESDSTILCVNETNISNSSFTFNFMKSQSDELISIIDLNNNRKIEYETLSRDCKLLKNVLN